MENKEIKVSEDIVINEDNPIIDGVHAVEGHKDKLPEELIKLAGKGVE